LQNPLIARFHHVRQIVVGQLAGWRETANRGDLRSMQESSKTIAIGTHTAILRGSSALFTCQVLLLCYIRGLMQVESTLFFESAEEIYTRVFATLKPRTPRPQFHIEFRRFANANSSIRLESGRIEVKITDLLEGAPAPITEALAYILLSKLYRKPIPPIYNHRYRLYLNRKDVRSSLHLLRQ